MFTTAVGEGVGLRVGPTMTRVATSARFRPALDGNQPPAAAEDPARFA
jgi:hypothetical protein